MLILLVMSDYLNDHSLAVSSHQSGHSFWTTLINRAFPPTELPHVGFFKDIFCKKLLHVEVCQTPTTMSSLKSPRYIFPSFWCELHKSSQVSVYKARLFNNETGGVIQFHWEREKERTISSPLSLGGLATSSLECLTFYNSVGSRLLQSQTIL